MRNRTIGGAGRTRTGALLAGLLAACGASQKPDATEGAAVDASGSSASAAPDASTMEWSKMSFDERVAHMQRAVAPKMQPIFTDLDAERYAKLTCGHCHGAGARERGFAMPSPDLAPVDPTDDFARARAEDPPMVEMMMKRMVPEMAASIGVDPYDPATGEGLGCFACHPRAS
ncbi:MAG: hypothetical protein JW751_21415 [Polyangiaceae bacterium]|nr:hypothetical protein [Polyangiaceae bacterium]